LHTKKYFFDKLAAKMTEKFGAFFLFFARFTVKFEKFQIFIQIFRAFKIQKTLKILANFMII